MKKAALLFLLCLALPTSSFAFLPPAHYIYAKLGEQRLKNPLVGVSLTLSRPVGSGAEESLGTISLSAPVASSGSWPGLTLILHNDTESLTQAVAAFGLVIQTEQELMRVERTKLSQMKEPPTPFYKTDETMSLRRARQTYAWVHSNKESGASLWVEKDSFLPLKISAPCPPQAMLLPWAKSGDNKCELEYRNLSALRRGNAQGTRMTLWKDGAPLLFLNFDRIGSAKTKLPPTDEKISPELKTLVETILH